MDIRQAARIMHLDVFDEYDFLSSSWAEKAFRGKIKYAPESFTVNDLSARKRMLFCAPNSSPTSSVVRSGTLDQVFMVEGVQGDLYKDSNYQNVYNLHQAAGTAQLWRAAPTGPIENPGWAINTLVQATFADIGFQRVSTDELRSVNQYGMYIVYLPSDSPAMDHDIVSIGGQSYFLYEVYSDQGLRVARATNRPEIRRNFVYVVVTNTAYNPATLTPGKTETPYNVTGQVLPVGVEGTDDENVLKDAVKVLIDATWIGVTPKIDDIIRIFGKDYLVKRITRNMIFDQWELLASV